MVKSIETGLDRVNIDDTEPEDEQEPLYQHGNKMETASAAAGGDPESVALIDEEE